MVCKQCGSYNDQGIKYCTVCGVQLEQASSSAPETAAQNAQTDKPSWGFVRSPRWPKPNFDLNAVDDMPLEEPEMDAGTQYDQSTFKVDSHGYESTAYTGQEYQPVEQLQQEFGDETNHFEPQPVQETPQYGNIRTIGSISDFDNSTYQGSFGRAPKRTAVYHMEDDDEGYTQPSRKRPAAIQQPSKSNARLPVSKQRSRSSSLRGGRHNNSILLGAAAFMVVVLLVLGVIFVNRNYGGFGGFFRNVFGGSPVLKDPVVTEGKNDAGADCYIITVFARKGNTVTLKVGDQELSDVIGSSNQKILRIPKASFLPPEPVDGATANLVPDVRITTDDGEVFQLEIDPIPVQVPALNFTLSEPSGASVAVGKPKVTFAGTVDPGASVRVEGQELVVNQDGTFAGDYELPEIGVHTLTVEARKNGYQIARQQIEADYTNAEANIEWTKSSLRISDGDTATVKGTVEPGATLTAKGPDGVTVGAPNVNAATGFFSFTVQMPTIGHYTIDVTLTKDGKSTSGSVVVEHAPDYATYTASVYKLDYELMSTMPAHKASYKCIGKVKEIVQSEPYYIAKLTTDKGDLLFEYHGSAATVELDDGKTYNVFGDYAGIDESTGLPLVYGWFITKG